ncbi:cytochrome b-c1 complex subunit 7 [Halictus rubicundus]|uniref:cytochrome b-c1 complex subunit 7 n=1 Tax=Halictus rubicundus TaxID=77578 RepID=UPI0040363DBC
MTFLKTLTSNVALRKWAYNTAGFRKYGLRRDDILHEYPEVEEAIRRLPKRIQEERIFRLVRAAQLEGIHRILPEEQWTKFEEDELYLTPLVDEVKREKAERERYDAM